jgi:hypothetical protein
VGNLRQIFFVLKSERSSTRRKTVKPEVEAEMWVVKDVDKPNLEKRQIENQTG